MEYEVTIGLEVHCQVKTNSKNFSSARNTYSEYPNENVDTVDIGLPGILPVYVRQYDLPNLSGSCRRREFERSHQVAVAVPCAVGLDLYRRHCGRLDCPVQFWFL